MNDQKIREAKEVVENKLIPVLEAMFWKGEKEHPEKTELINTCKILKDLAQSFLSIQEPREKKYHKEATDRFQPESCCCQCCQKYHYNQALKDSKLYHLKQMEKEFCKCKEPKIILITHCRICKKEVKNPPTIREMLEDET